MLKLLIADGTEEFALALSDVLEDAFSIRICSRGREVLSLLHSFQPDLLVLDLMLPELDGISLLQQARREGMRPMVLVTSRFISDYVLETLESLDVGYAMRKPCDICATVERLKDLAQRLGAGENALLPEPREQVSALLLHLGVAARVRGFACLREAVLLMMEDPARPITKEIYPMLGALMDGNAAQMEHAIRGAITKAWRERTPEIWNNYFPQDANGASRCPTNKEFICRLAASLSQK